MTMLKVIREAFGDELTAYILGGLDLSGDPVVLTDVQNDALSRLVDVANLVNSEPARFGKETNREVIFKFNDAVGTTTVRHLHLLCGGKALEIESTDPVEKPLLTIARDLYASFLLPQDSSASNMGPSVAREVYLHPATVELERAVLEDDDLKRLFPHATPDDLVNQFDSTNIVSDVMFSNGSGGTLSLAQLPNNILELAFAILAGRGGGGCTVLLELVSDSLTIARRLATKQKSGVPTLVGLCNVALAPDIDVLQIDDATRIRRMHPRDVHLTRERSPGELMLETRTDLKILSISKFEPHPTSPSADEGFDRYTRNQTQFNATAEAQTQVINKCRFALLLASDDGALVAATQSFFTVFNPLSSGRLSSNSPYRFLMQHMPSQTIDKAVAERAKHWYQELKKQPKQLDMGMRRLLSASTTRLDPLDGFVDAVISWENMFGTPEGESTFRISGAIAVLLEPSDTNARKKLFKEVGELYKIRSKLVHGASEPDYTTALAHRNRAVQIGLDSLRQVYEAEELLAAENSSVRGRIAVLNF